MSQGSCSYTRRQGCQFRRRRQGRGCVLDARWIRLAAQGWQRLQHRALGAALKRPPRLALILRTTTTKPTKENRYCRVDFKRQRDRCIADRTSSHSPRLFPHWGFCCRYSCGKSPAEYTSMSMGPIYTIVISPYLHFQSLFASR